MRRCLGLSLEAGLHHPNGRNMASTHQEAAERALRVLVIDHVFGAEAIDDLNAEQNERRLRVTLADYDRTTGWRHTLLCLDTEGGFPDRELEATWRGLRALWNGADSSIAESVYQATHRAIPEVTRYLWRHAAREITPDAELIGHMGVAVFASSMRTACILTDGASWPEGYARWKIGLPAGTILLSMDSLQRWTWTRRSGTRGDFIAVTPDRTDKNLVWILAIESKGSAGDGLYNGCRQAAVAAEKLETRFAGEHRWQERQELMNCLAQEGFRATGLHREAHDRIGRAYSPGTGVRIGFQAVCVSTCRESAGFRVSVESVPGHERKVLWFHVGGLEGLRALAGLEMPSEPALARAGGAHPA